MNGTDQTAVVAAATKPGWKTSEFWMTAATSAVALMNQALGWQIPPETIITVAGSVAAYALSRAGAKRASATAPVMRTGSLLIAIGLAASLTGCGTLKLAPVAPGNDPVVVRAEQTTQLAIDTFNLIEKTEYDLYPTLKQVSPATAIEVRTYVNSLRRQESDWLETARNVTKAYKANRTEANKASVEAAMAVLQTGINEANKYIAKMNAKTSAWNRLRSGIETSFGQLWENVAQPIGLGTEKRTHWEGRQAGAPALQHNTVAIL